MRTGPVTLEPARPMRPPGVRRALGWPSGPRLRGCEGKVEVKDSKGLCGASAHVLGHAWLKFRVRPTGSGELPRMCGTVYRSAPYPADVQHDLNGSYEIIGI